MTISQVSDKDTVVSYAITGTAGNGTDFTTLSGSVTIAAGATAATIDVDVIDDSLLEDSETVVLTLTGTDDPDVSVDTSLTANTATVNIADDDTASVAIVANDVTAAEPGNDGQFTVTISDASDKDTVVNYVVTGTADSGTDFTTLPGSITIEAGQTSATIDINVIDDSLLEDNETVVLTLTGTDDVDVSVDTTPGSNTATVNIADDDTASVSIIANDPDAAEPSDDGQFTVSISQISDKDTVVNYAITGTAENGSDFTTLSGSVTILAGETTATIDVETIDSDLLEDNETVILTLTGTDDPDVTVDTDAGANTATVTIADDDTATVSITANDASAAEPNDDGQFTVSISQVSDKDTVVNYAINGTADNGDDYVTLSGSVTIAAGESSASINVDVIDSILLESSESVILTLTGTDDPDVTVDTTRGADTATVTIADDDAASVSIVANDATASEPSDDGQFTVSLTAPSDTDTVISYTVAGDAAPGTDYTQLSGEVTILAGETSATIDLHVLDDSVLELTENVSIALTDVTSGSPHITIGSINEASIDITDDETASVSILANDDIATESGDGGQFTVTLSTPAAFDTTINYSVAGDAIADDDYQSLSGSVVIVAGQTSATIDVSTIDNAILEGDENVVVTLTSTDPSVIAIDQGSDSASVTILDDETAQVSIVAVDAEGAEGTPLDHGKFEVTLSTASDSATTIGYAVGGSAEGGEDYEALLGSVEFAAGQTSAIIDVNVNDDYLLETSETVVVTLNEVIAGDDDISISSTNEATVTIADNEVNPPLLSSPENVTTDEDTTSWPFVVSARTVQDDGSEVLQVIIDGVIEGATLSDGLNRFTGSSSASSVDVTTWDLNNLTIRNSENLDSDFVLTIEATATSSDPTDDTPPATTSTTTSVSFHAVADAPTLSVNSSVVGNEDAAISLSIDAALVDTDGSEALEIQIAGVPIGATLSAGADLGGGVWSLSQDDLQGLTITPPAGSDAEFDLTITAIASESNPTTTDPTVTTLSAESQASIAVQVDAVADTPDLQVTSTTTGNEDNAIALDITSSLRDEDGSETLLIQISGVPSGAFLNAGTDLGAGTWELTPEELAGLTITPPSDSDVDFQLTVTAIATESNPTTSDTTVATATSDSQAVIDVEVIAVADAPIVTAPTSVIAGEGVASVPFSVSAELADTDGSESITLMISGIQNGATLTDGVNTYTSRSNNGRVDITQWDWENLTIAASDAPPRDFVMSITATASESAEPSRSTTTQSIAVDVYNVNDTPIAHPEEFVAIPNKSLVVDLSESLLSNDFDEDGDVLTAVIIQAPEHGTLTLNPDGTFTYVPDLNFFGNDSFVYAATDGVATSNPVEVKILVGGVLEDEEPTKPRERIKFKDTTRGTSIDSVLDTVEGSPSDVQVSSNAGERLTKIDTTAVTRERVTDRVNIDRDPAGYGDIFISVSRDTEEFEREKEEAVIEEVENVTFSSVLWRTLDEMGERESQSWFSGRFTVGVAALLVAMATYAYVVWTVWSGYLITSVLSMMPGWRFLDPLPVLDQEEDEDADDQESLASLLDDNE